MARLLSALEIPGNKEPTDTFHVTVLYLGDKVPIEQLGKAIIATYSVTSATTPFTVRTNRVTAFEPHDDGTPIICPIDSPGLHELREKLTAALDKAGVEYSKKFPIFVPHMTLGYSKDPGVYADHAADQDFPTVEWGAAELVLWGGDEGDDRLVATFPFSLRIEKKALYRAFVRLAMIESRL